MKLIRHTPLPGIFRARGQRSYPAGVNHPTNTKETQMSKLKPHYALPFILILAGALPGCATYAKCESGECSGDAKITTNVQTLLNQHSELGAPNSINVQTRAHV